MNAVDRIDGHPRDRRRIQSPRRRWCDGVLRRCRLRRRRPIRGSSIRRTSGCGDRRPLRRHCNIHSGEDSHWVSRGPWRLRVDAHRHNATASTSPRRSTLKSATARWSARTGTWKIIHRVVDRAAPRETAPSQHEESPTIGRCSASSSWEPASAGSSSRRCCPRRSATTSSVTLIDSGDGFVFGYSKLDVMFGRATPEAVRLPYREFAKPGVRFLRETITAIDPEARRVTTDAGVHEADVLVVALGADYDVDATPGLAEGGNEFYSVAGAERLRGRAPDVLRGATRSSASAAPRSSARRRRARRRCCCTTT